MKDLIEALQIFAKYTDEERITICEHDILYINISPDIVSQNDKDRLNQLGFWAHDNDDNFSSTRFGSC